MINDVMANTDRLTIAEQRLKIIDLEYNLAMAKIDVCYMERMKAIADHYNPRMQRALCLATGFTGILIGILITTALMIVTK